MSATYDETEALLHLRYALVAFCGRAPLERWDCGPLCARAPALSPRLLGPGARLKVQGYVAKLPTASNEPVRCVLAFRGTQPKNLGNFLADADFFLRRWPPREASAALCPGCKVHGGFARAYEELRPAVLSAIRELSCGAWRLTGHSLGAAVATLAAMDLRMNNITHVEAVWTFGKPRLGNAAFASSFAATAAKQGVSPSTWRIVHFHDLTARIPPYNFMGMRHEGLEVYYLSRHFPSPFQICGAEDPSVENASCSLATPLSQWYQQDHENYLGINNGHETRTQECGFTNGEDGDKIELMKYMGISVGILIVLSLIAGLTLCFYQRRSRCCCSKRLTFDKLCNNARPQTPSDDGLQMELFRPCPSS